MDSLDVDQLPNEHRRTWRQSISSTRRLSHAGSQSLIQAPAQIFQHGRRDRRSTTWKGGFTADEFTRYQDMLSELKPITDAPIPDLNFDYSLYLEEGACSRLSVHSLDSEASNEKIYQLPGKRQPRPVRAFRHTLWNVYRRLFSLVFLVNLVALLIFVLTTKNVRRMDLWNVATASSANIFVATAIRQDYVQGIIYRASWLIPHSAPLRLRRILAKVYENGGIHSGCGVSGAFWFILLTVVISIQFASGAFTSKAVIIITYVLMALFLAILIFAYPSFRFKSHNTFEITHRFAGWTVIILFWVELGLLADATALSKEHAGIKTSVGEVLLKQPTFWLLLLTTFHTILPWLNLRKWEFEPENLSNHAVRLHFKRTLPPFTGIAISKSPLLEWHPFATMPSLIGEPTGGSLIVSAAGDWTKDAVKRPRTTYWVKGFPKPGVLSMSVIFKRVVIVTTGSGIGPCLSIMMDPNRRMACRVLWSSPSPEGIFGNEIVDSVRRVDPLAVIIDTRTQGRPDMVALTYRLYVEAAAEAVFVISNPMLTRKIVYAMESRGVPAFGPIWDS